MHLIMIESITDEPCCFSPYIVPFLVYENGNCVLELYRIMLLDCVV